MDCAFFAIAFNIKKLSSKIAKQTKNGEIHPILDCINKYQHFYRLRIRFFGEKSSKIGRLKNIRTSVAKNQRLCRKKTIITTQPHLSLVHSTNLHAVEMRRVHVVRVNLNAIFAHE